MKKVWADAHHHVWDLAVRPRPWTDAWPALRWSFGMDETYPRLRADGGADAAVVVRTGTVPEETPELLALAEMDPDAAGVAGVPDAVAALTPDLGPRTARDQRHRARPRRRRARAADAARPGRAAMTAVDTAAPAVDTAAPGAGADRGVADRPHAERILRGRGRLMVGCIQGNASPLRGLQW